MRRLLLALALLALTASPAAAAPRWLDSELPFGDAPALPDGASAAMLADGTVIVARLAPDGALEVRERPPGGPFGATITLARATELPPQPRDLNVLATGEHAAVMFLSTDRRYASLRSAAGRWTKPDEAAPAGSPAAPTGPTALASDGALWSVGRTPTGAGRLAVYRLEGDGPPSFTPLPLDGRTHTQSAVSVTHAGDAHVVFAELSGETLANGRCVLRTAIRAVDVSAAGDPGPVQALERIELQGNGTADACLPNGGELLQPPLLLADGADGADTLVWTQVRFPPGQGGKTLARHREPGAPWVADGPPEEIGASVNGERLLGGRGAPLVVLSFEFGRLITTRRPDGTWTAPMPLLRFEPFLAARTGTGGAAFAWVSGTDIVGRVFDPAGGLGDTVTIAPASPEAALLALGADQEGNAVALSSDRRGDAFALRANGYDAAGPRVTSLALPEAAVAGVSELFSAEGLDVWSGPARDARWDFGDGAVEDGLTRPHAYAAGGRRTVEVRLRDAVGNESSATAALDVAGAPAAPGPVAVPTTPPPPPRDTRAPRLTGVSVTPRRPHTARPGLLQLTTSEAGKVRVVLTKVARGTRSGGRCVIVKRPRGKKLCTRTVGRRTVTRTVGAGAGRVALPRLGAGTWKVRVTITDAAGNESNARALTVRVAR